MEEVLKQRIQQRAFEFLKDITNENNHTQKELRSIYKEVGRSMYKLKNTYSMVQLITDIINEEYVLIGIDPEDLNLFIE